ncbi:ABC transporter permease [Mesorhizobium sp. M1060]|jgi:spermidine/putrescine transport system permease protein|uniref:ABC transporter permease n=1 Tax=unclassified Mesorhizobium TaxID=325217 RepID=UPI0003CE7081|nr:MULTISPECIES: ABC transporter permease [unclassified Mesorhizobium]ESW81859.1 spermidine/putrescine ABC transporter [Mesorhizobium sp. LSJC269B00]ESX22851.1 spermidine/putrescine ABC transporter [Mesorhizobium sp. LSJC264A00]ESX84608.1 spermidine/putrescine ABC transporter [Mesorhizobium sp. LSHC412B00]ESY13037.1 spermidine/putrescine ABC transporter [Mesorhizobium sp. LNJC398B00]ESY33981.1 spermidine/putrescine ABC transporter [Mesorhizobium sp. LNJC386A00]
MTARRRLFPGGWLSAYALLYVVFLYLPVIFLPIFSINTAPTPKFPLTGYTLKWYQDLPKTPALLDAAWNSLIVGISASVLSTLLGILAARSITRYRYPGRRTINGLIMAPLVLPEIILAISMLLVMLQLGLSLSLFTVVLGHVLICIPYSMTVLTAGFEGFDRSLEEASADLGESAFGTFRRVTLPMVAPAIISSLLVCFTISLDEFVIAFFLTGTETTLPIYIWGQLRFAAKLPGVLALGTLLLVASFVLMTVAEILRRHAARRTQSEGGLYA